MGEWLFAGLGSPGEAAETWPLQGYQRSGSGAENAADLIRTDGHTELGA
jgi:hypothetical protein